MITFPSLIPFTQMVKRALGDELAPGVENYLDLFTDGATFDFPFSPGGAVRVEGKAKMAEYLASIEGGVVFDTMNLDAKYSSDDGQTTVLEYHCTGSNAETGRPYLQNYIGVLKLSDGRLTSLSEFFNPLLTLQADDKSAPGLARIEPHPIRVAQSELDDLGRRLAETRWPARETVSDDSQGAPLNKVRALCEYWRDNYDWRRCEAQLNSWNPSRITIDGLDVFFLHIRSPHSGALPMIVTHGWPGSIWEFHKVIEPLRDPTSHGGRASDAFHLVIPCLPGFGFSGQPSAPGWDIERTAWAWITLMERLGYGRGYVAQGGDWGAAVTGTISQMLPPGCRAIHLNTLFNGPQPGDEKDASPLAQRAMEKANLYDKTELGYLAGQSTKPQTVGYGLADSPAAQAAWIYEKLQSWTDNPGEVEALLTRDEMLDNIMLYWLPNAGASSARMYWESLGDLDLHAEIPTGISMFWNDITPTPREWAQRSFSNIVYWNDVEHGGHFAALEQPELFVDELRKCFRNFR